MSSSKRKLVDFRIDPTSGVFLPPGATEHFAYSDGEPEEQTLLQILESAQDRSTTSDTLRNEKRDWSSEYHCTPLRHNLLRHLQFKKGASLLELGAGCGAITRQFGELGLAVTAVEGSPLRAKINRVRCADLENVKVYAANFGEIEYSEKYDYVTLIGVLEYSRQFIDTKDPIQTVLEMAASLLKDDGVLLVAIENQLGLKYLCGYSEDHSSIQYQGVEDLYGAKTAVTFGKRELTNRLKQANLAAVQCNYPYPDYKLPDFVLTDRGANDERFMAGEIVRQGKTRDYAYPDFSPSLRPSLVATTLDRNGLLGELANSFLFLAGKTSSAVDAIVDPGLLGVYYSTARAVPYWISTSFVAEEGTISVNKARIAPNMKLPDSPVLAHQLSKQEYKKGVNIGAEIVKAVQIKDFQRISELLGVVVQHIQQNALAEPVRENALNTRIKPDWIDAIPSNMILTESGAELIDQEWRSTREFTLGELFLRVIDELRQIEPQLPDLSRDGLLQIFAQSGYTIDQETHRRYDQLISDIVQQVYKTPAVPNIPVSHTVKTEEKMTAAPVAKRRSLPVLPNHAVVPAPQSIAMHDKFDYGDEFENFICPNPFLYGEVRADGELATCCYLPFTFGNIKKEGLDKAWNSPTAKAVRSSILDGSYRFCDKRKCATMQQVTNPEKQASYKYQVPYQLFSREEVLEGPLGETFKGQLELNSAGPKIVSFEDDPSCNLACPSCRVKPMMISKESSGDMYDLEVSLLDALGPQLEQVWFAGAGDPFVSRSYRRLYKEYDFERFPKLKFRLDTNGVPLTPKTWNELLRKVKHKVGLVCLSIDAATKETYDITRVGGNFDLLMNNLAFICSVPERQQGMGILIRMIVQQKNFREMKQFVELGKRMGVDAVVFSVIQNWGTFSDQDYKQAAVHVPTSQHYAELREILSDPIFEDPIVNIGNLSDLYFDVRKDTAWTRAIQVTDASKTLAGPTPNTRAIAFYLPQFHPIPENDEWWGKGFTEWTNVTKARPLYEGHYQPHIPTDLGYYDLRLPETREAQAELAKGAGIEAFCYWHYWFAGRRVLERPFQEVVASKHPNFGFCLGWANASWTGIWHGAPNRTLIEQTYPGLEDYKNHFNAILPALRDERYFRVNGKPLVLLYAPHELPSSMEFTSYWRELAHKAGVGDLHFVAHMTQNPTPFGCDTAVLNAPFTQIPTPQLEVRPLPGEEAPRVWTYDSFIKYMETSSLESREHPIVFPNWDNTPRSGSRGLVLEGSSPELFLQHLRDAVSKAQHFPDAQERIVFIKAWNEWAEGNYLEPDKKFGHAYLDAVRIALFEAPLPREARAPKTEIVQVQESIPSAPHAKYQGTDSIPAVVAAADSLASKGDLVGAVNEISKHISGTTPVPAGVQMRLAEWNLALGNGEQAIFAALQELTTRPDNQKALGILLHDQPTLFKVLAQVPAPTVRLVEQIINSYAQRGGM